MLEASHGERTSMPRGICRSQKLMVCPNTRGSTPRTSRCDATDRPYGPAPMTAISSMTAMFFPGSLIVANLVTVIGARQGPAFRVKCSLQGLGPHAQT